MSKTANDLLPYSIGERPNTVRVFRRPGRRSIYIRTWNPSKRGGRGGWEKRSLGHDDPEKAKAQAAELHARLVAGREALRGERDLTLRHLLALYEKHRTPQKGKQTRRADRRRSELWTRVLGAGKAVAGISRAEWDGFVARRSSGAIDARGEPVPETAPCPACGDAEEPDDACGRCGGSGRIEPRRSVGPNTVRKDCQYLLAVLNWAVDWRTEHGEYLLRENPCRGYPLPREKNPRRPVATDDRVRAIRETAPRVEMEVTWAAAAGPDEGRAGRRTVRSHLPALFDLAVETGRRLSSILRLRYSDFIPDRGPHGSVRWRAEEDKEGRESVVPLSALARAAVDRHAARLRRLGLPGIGDAPLFPSPESPAEPTSRYLADKWLREAERLAGVEPHDGSLRHAYRRHWATARKRLPAPDVAAAGGWAGPETLERVYQQADEETMYEVVSGGGEVREVRG